MTQVFVVNIFNDCNTIFFIPELTEKLAAHAKSEFLTNAPGIHYTCRTAYIKKAGQSAEHDDAIFLVENTLEDEAFWMGPDDFKNPNKTDYQYYEFSFFEDGGEVRCETWFLRDDSAGNYGVHRCSDMLDLINHILSLVDDLLAVDYEKVS